MLSRKYLYVACNGRPKRVLKFKIEFKTYWLICNYMFYAPGCVNKRRRRRRRSLRAQAEASMPASFNHFTI